MKKNEPELRLAQIVDYDIRIPMTTWVSFRYGRREDKRG